MAPRREYGPPTRRSARQASAEAGGDDKDAARVTKPTIPRKAAKASATAWDVGRAVERIASGDLAYIRRLTHAKRAVIIEAFVSREVDLKSRLEELESANERLLQERDRALAEARGKRNMHAEAQQARIAEMQQRQQQIASSFAGSLSSTSSSPSSPAVVQAALTQPTTSPASSSSNNIGVQEQEVTITSATPLSAPQAESTPVGGMWRSYLKTVGGIFSPFKRLSTPQPQPTVTKRSAPEDDDEPTPSTSKRARVAEPSPRAYCGTAAKDSRMPTSLSTINEFTEPGNSTFMDPTPSKPPQSRTPVAPSQSRASAQTPKVPSQSRAPAQTPTMPPPPPRAPAQTPVMPPPQRLAPPATEPPAARDSVPSPTSIFVSSEGPRQRRTVASVRAARAAAKTPSRTPYSWQRSAAPKPAERNADRRLEKLQDFRKVQKHYEQLQNDKDVIEMQSHRRKRVKVDDLEVIPHNLPGDSSSTFRVPDWDSDDEMEVDESVPERKNVFSMQAQQQQQTEPQATPHHHLTTPADPSMADEMSFSMEIKPVEDKPAENVDEEPIDFGFPSVGPRLPEHDISEEESERLGDEFAASFDEYLRENSYVHTPHGFKKVLPPGQA